MDIHNLVDALFTQQQQQSREANILPVPVKPAGCLKTKTYKIGLNRGNGRVWVEGKVLESCGFTCGTQYNRVDNIAGGEISLFAGTGSRRVTNGNKKGKARPVIDLSDSTISKLFAGCSRAEVEFYQGMIIYRGAK